MSRYEWERGTITIPGSEWAKFKLAVRTAYNAWQAENLRLATVFYEQLQAAGKGKRGFDYRKAFDPNTAQPPLPLWRQIRDYETIDHHAITTALFGPAYEKVTVDGREQWRPVPPRSTPLQPKKKDFPEANGATTRIPIGNEGSISFDEKARQVTWNVGENNHSVTKAHEHPIGRAFFAALNKVQWGTRGQAGGVLLYGSEYDRESAESYEGGGGSRASARYGPAGTRSDPMQAFLRTRRRSSKPKKTASMAGNSRRF